MSEEVHSNVIPASRLKSRVAELLSKPSLGLVAEVRPSQLKMSAGVEDVITNGGLYAVEAPVGSGKTYAYLLPALLAGRRVLVVTPKKSLQDQIVGKDLPALQKAIGHTIPVVLLKGKGNYTCQLVVANKQLTNTAQGAAEYAEFILNSRYGDRGDWQGQVPMWWGKASAENCVGNSCPYAKSCGYMRLKQELSSAQVVVGNHHLLGFDLVWGAGKIVGGEYDVLIVDEAHKLADGLRAAFTQTLTDASAEELARKLRDEVDLFEVRGLHNLTAAWAEMFDSLRSTPACTPMCNRYGMRGCFHWKQPHERAAPVFSAHTVHAVMGSIDEIKSSITAFLKTIRVDSNGAPAELPQDMQYPVLLLERAATQLDDWKAMLLFVQGEIPPPSAGKDEDGEDCEPMSEEDAAARAARIMENTLIHCQVALNGKVQLQAVPVTLAPLTGQKLGAIKSVVLASATLAVDGEFDNIRTQFGVTPTKTDILPAVFDYNKQAVLYAPKDLVPVSRPPKYKEDDIEAMRPYKEYINQLVERCAWLINTSKGGAFILCTAKEDMKLLDAGIRQRCRFPIFTQERDGDPQAVLQAFLKAKNAVLIGLKSFWEGVDVQGGALRLVIIPKLPFPAAKDPLMEARRRAAGNGNAREGWPFVDYPDMLMDLRQGSGRLIRSSKDRGMVAILDGRLWTKGYGQRVLKALPYRQITSKAENVTWYLGQMAKDYG